ncbi:MAG: preprotein translocase subunit SecA [Planctomycetes bacterium]|nr:preprotein translocase subunit SecA [Planctomycetota bacterium]NBY01245.1 preprotein translocase subunit SecA [Planctomycetota bacterium]
MPVQTSFLDRLIEFFSSFPEMVGKLLLSILGDSNERYVRSLGFVRSNKPDSVPKITPGTLLAKINDVEPEMLALSDDELRQMASKLRERLAQGETLDSLLPVAFAACRESARRSKNMRHFDVQMLGGIVLHRGNIAEMVTGEGKTLVATLPAVLNALEGKGVHVITVNDYLARRDCEWMLPIYRGVGLTAGYIQSDMDPVKRRQAYECDITYGTNSEFGFDYLRDNMKPARWGDSSYDVYGQQCQKGLHFAIIDEVDNILIDEARTPLIISGQAFSDLRKYTKANEVAVRLTDLQRSANKDSAEAGFLNGPFFEVKEKEHTCHLTDEGIRKAEELAGVESFYTAGNMEWPHLIDNSLKAHHLYKKDKQYAVMNHPETGEMSIIIIDEFTGRLMVGRQWSDGLHQAVEAKHYREGVKIKEETQTLATITLQNFFKLYKKVCGMTGTAMTEADEFWKIYKLEVIAIPTNRPLIRKNHPDTVFRSEKEKWKAVVEEVVEVHQTGRPILIGTTDVDKSIKLSDLLRRKGIKHELLNALPEHAARESEIVSQAGRIGALTIATNMAGRGTDIILGGNPESMAWAVLKTKYASRLDVPEDEWKIIVADIEAKEKTKEEGRKVKDLGGLHIIGTERHDSRRIDNQLRGRAGRQGDPGSSRFYLSLQDDLMRIFMGEWVANVLTRLGMEEGQAIESPMVSRQIQKAQKKVEERHFESRKHLLEYDEVMDTQRRRVYGYRQEILNDTNCKIRILEMIAHQIKMATDRFLDRKYGADSFAQYASDKLGVEFKGSDFDRSTFEEAELYAKNRALSVTLTQLQDFIEENLGSDDESEWNWQALTNQVNKRWGLDNAEKTLKSVGKSDLIEYLAKQTENSVEKISLQEGSILLQSKWGLSSLLNWMKLKFQIEVPESALVNQPPSEVEKILVGKAKELYRQKEITFPVAAGMAKFMNEGPSSQAVPGSQKYNREGLHKWAQSRFHQFANELSEESFRTLSRAEIQQLLVQVSFKAMPQIGQDDIDQKLSEAFHGTQVSEDGDAKDLCDFMRSQLQIDIPNEKLTGVSQDTARQIMWNTFDDHYRPEMRIMERGLVLAQLDSTWKNHLYVMDHLRSTVGLRGYAQEDPKTVYKREGMKEFEAMWDGVEERVSEIVFRMEDADEVQDTVWVIGSATHESAPRLQAPESQSGAPEEIKQEKKVETIRNTGERIGRNDPCTCGSGKKYKNCCMRSNAI